MKKQIKFCKNYIVYIADYFTLKKHNKNRLKLSWKNRLPCLYEKTSQTYFDRHYVYHTGWAARILAKANPEVHIDISSSLYFISIASAFVPIQFYDYRPAKLQLSNLSCGSQDVTNLSFDDNSIPSLSCMHVVEHIGLGRYGDPIDPDGDLKAIKELQRVLAPGGSLLFVVPVGKPKIFFNAHRVYSKEQIVHYFDTLTLKEFALIPNKESNGEISYNPRPEKVERETYGCGCFWFTK